MAAQATNTAPDGGHTSPKNSNNSDRTTDEDREFNKNAIFDPAAEPPAAKRPRGRPPGSKNKPKPPSFVAVDPNDAFRSHIMEVAPGADVAASLAAYARAHRCGVAVLHATGSVAGGVSFRHVGPFKGHFEIISLRGTVFPDTSSPPLSALTLFIASGPAGNVLGGLVSGPLIAAGPVMVTAATFSATAIEKLPPAVSVSVNGSDNSDPVPGPTKVSPDGPETGSGYNPGFNNMNMGMPNWRQDGLQYGWHPHQQQQDNGRRYFQ